MSLENTHVHENKNRARDFMHDLNAFCLTETRGSPSYGEPLTETKRTQNQDENEIIDFSQ